MFDFLKNFFGTAKHKAAESDTISEANLNGEVDIAESQSQKGERPFVTLDLYLPPEEANRTSEMQKEFMRKELSELPPVKEGDITINGIYVVKSGEGLEVGVYIRNGLSRPIRFDSIPLVITNLKNEVLARQIFSGGELGEIPPHSARPWEIEFSGKNIFVEEIKYDDWKVAFDLQSKPSQQPVKVTLDLPEGITAEQRTYIEQFLEKLPPLMPGELNISAFNANLQEDRMLLATVLIRNGGQRPVKIEQLPLTLKDAQDRDAASGQFNIEGLVIKPHSARLWTFAFPPETVVVDDLDLSSWSIYHKQ